MGLATALSLFGDLTLFAALATRVDEAGLQVAQLGILFSIHRFVRLPGNPLAGWLADWLGRRPLFITGMVLAVVSTIGYGLGRGFWFFLACRVAWGLAWALINVCGMNMVMDISDLHTRGRYNGFFTLAIYGGYAFGPLAGGLLVDALTFRWAMLSLAGFSAVGLLVAILALPETRPQVGGAGGAALVRSTFSQRLVGIIQAYRSLGRGSGGIPTGMVLGAIIRFAEDGVMLSTIVLLLSRQLGSQVQVGVAVVGIATASGAFSAVRAIFAGGIGPFSGWLSDRFGRLQVVAAGLALGLLSYLGLAFFKDNLLLVGAIILGAIGSGAFTPIPAYVRDHTSPEKQGLVLGAFATTCDLGSMLGPLLVFGLVGIIGLGGIYLGSAALYLAAIALALSRLKKG